MEEIGGNGWAKPAHYPHISTQIPVAPKEPLFKLFGNLREVRKEMGVPGGGVMGILSQLGVPLPQNS